MPDRRYNTAALLVAQKQNGYLTAATVDAVEGRGLQPCRLWLAEQVRRGRAERVGRGRYVLGADSAAVKASLPGLGHSCRPGWLRLAAHAAMVYAGRLTDAINESDGPVARGLVDIRREVHGQLARLEAAL